MSEPVSYLRPGVGPGHAIIEVIDALQRHLKQPANSRGYIHRIRVDIKRLRAWLRMIRDHSAAHDWKTTDRSLGAIAKALSSRRDAQVMVETLKWLSKKSRKDNEKHAIEEICARIQFDLVHHPVDWNTVKPALADELSGLRQQAILLKSDKIIIEGLKRTYKRSFKYGNKAFSGDGSTEDLHELRKWVKYLYYQVGYIQAEYPEQYVNERKYLDKLGNRLGRIHDLHLLEERLDELSFQPDCSGAARVVRKIMHKRLDKLIKQSEFLYKKIFTLSPSRFVQKIC